MNFGSMWVSEFSVNKQTFKIIQIQDKPRIGGFYIEDTMVNVGFGYGLNWSVQSFYNIGAPTATGEVDEAFNKPDRL